MERKNKNSQYVYKILHEYSTTFLQRLNGASFIIVVLFLQWHLNCPLPTKYTYSYCIVEESGFARSNHAEEGLEHGLMNYKDTKPPPSLPCVNNYTVYTYTKCGGEYGLIGGKGPQADKTPAASLFTGHSFQTRTFGIAFSQSNLSTAQRRDDMKCLEPVFMGGEGGRCSKTRREERVLAQTEF